MKYTIIFSTDGENMQEIGGDIERIIAADIVIGCSGIILKDRYGNAASVLADLYRRATA